MANEKDAIRSGALDPECECDSGLPAKFWTGDGWMCGECYDEREEARDLERA